jgi:hypothetical protein
VVESEVIEIEDIARRRGLLVVGWSVSHGCGLRIPDDNLVIASGEATATEE